VTTVTADSTTAGAVIAVQSESHVDTTLDAEVRWHVADAVARHTVMQQLDTIGGQRHGRSDRLRVA
jgi:hypothetical protein